ncbi:MAG: response regulator transcription factor [Gemmatimonadales bacterium]
MTMTEQAPAQTAVTRVVLADDHALFRDGLATLLGRVGGLEIVGVASEGRQALELCKELNPDVLLVDLQMPGMDGLDVLDTMSRELPGVRTIVLSAFDADEDVYRAVRAGAAAYCLKSSSPAELAETILAVAKGTENRIPAPLLAKLSTYIRRPRLTARELEILHLVAGGLSNMEIATTLHIAEGTVKTHIKSILAKLEARDRSQAMVIGMKRGLVRPE